MLKRVSIETRKSAGLPADILVAFILPALAIFALVFGPQRTSIVLLLVGLFEFAVAFPMLRRSKSSMSGWLAVVVGHLRIGFAFAQW